MCRELARGGKWSLAGRAHVCAGSTGRRRHGISLGRKRRELLRESAKAAFRKWTYRPFREWWKLVGRSIQQRIGTHPGRDWCTCTCRSMYGEYVVWDPPRGALRFRSECIPAPRRSLIHGDADRIAKGRLEGRITAGLSGPKDTRICDLCHRLCIQSKAAASWKIQPMIVKLLGRRHRPTRGEVTVPIQSELSCRWPW